uniref:F-box domain-containing protein n=1 Tax=Mycena chlorophos TaxID=658473 RepID=A0ABQ0LDM0_MYCCL|nr:predicted protein [Mycena chlorophos]
MTPNLANETWLQILTELRVVDYRGFQHLKKVALVNRQLSGLARTLLFDTLSFRPYFVRDSEEAPPRTLCLPSPEEFEKQSRLLRFYTSPMVAPGVRGLWVSLKSNRRSDGRCPGCSYEDCPGTHALMDALCDRLTLFTGLKRLSFRCSRLTESLLAKIGQISRSGPGLRIEVDSCSRDVSLQGTIPSPSIALTHLNLDTLDIDDVRFWLAVIDPARIQALRLGEYSNIYLDHVAPETMSVFPRLTDLFVRLSVGALVTDLRFWGSRFPALKKLRLDTDASEDLVYLAPDHSAPFPHLECYTGDTIYLPLLLPCRSLRCLQLSAFGSYEILGELLCLCPPTLETLILGENNPPDIPEYSLLRRVFQAVPNLLELQMDFIVMYDSADDWQHLRQSAKFFEEIGSTPIFPSGLRALKLRQIYWSFGLTSRDAPKLELAGEAVDTWERELRVRLPHLQELYVHAPHFDIGGPDFDFSWEQEDEMVFC